MIFADSIKTRAAKCLTRHHTIQYYRDLRRSYPSLGTCYYCGRHQVASEYLHAGPCSSCGARAVLGSLTINDLHRI